MKQYICDRCGKKIDVINRIKANDYKAELCWDCMKDILKEIYKHSGIGKQVPFR